MDFTVYANGLCYMSVCTTLPPEKVEERANVENPTGTSTRWSIASEPFRDGAPNPHACERLPGTHRHYLLSC